MGKPQTAGAVKPVRTAEGIGTSDKWMREIKVSDSKSDVMCMMSRGSTGGIQDSESTDEDIEMYVDTGANGSIWKKAYAGVTDVKEKINGCVRGVTGSTIAITHTGISNKIGSVYIVPKASANLLSVSTLMRQGCTLGAKGNDL